MSASYPLSDLRHNWAVRISGHAVRPSVYGPIGPALFTVGELLELGSFISNARRRAAKLSTERRDALTALGCAGSRGEAAMDMNSDQAMQTVGEREMTAEPVTKTMEACGRHYAAVTGTNPEQWD
ncbi:helicase associated domain-containing protein, partial [Streptomyces justiciae]